MTGAMIGVWTRPVSQEAPCGAWGFLNGNCSFCVAETARNPPQRGGFPWSGAGSIRRPLVFQTSALPTELPDQETPTCGVSGGDDEI